MYEPFSRHFPSEALGIFYRADRVSRIAWHNFISPTWRLGGLNI